MYRINYTGRPVLLTVDEFVAKAPTDQDVNIRLVLQNIEVAEERFIVQAIGNTFYEELIGMKNVQITSDNQADQLALINASLAAASKQTITSTQLPIGTWVNAIEYVTNVDYVNLWQRFLWRLCAEAVDAMTTVPSWLQHTAQGQQSNNPITIGSDGKGSGTGSAKDVQYKLSSIMKERIAPLQASMHAWLCEKKYVDPTLYPNYFKICESCLGDRPHSERERGVATQGKTDMLMDIYPHRHRSKEINEDWPLVKRPFFDFNATTTSPTQMGYDIKRFQFTTVAGQQQYPTGSESNYQELNNYFVGAELINMSMEGTELFIGTDDGDMNAKPLQDNKVTWITPAPSTPLRCILTLKKKL